MERLGHCIDGSAKRVLASKATPFHRRVAQRWEESWLLNPEPMVAFKVSSNVLMRSAPTDGAARTPSAERKEIVSLLSRHSASQTREDAHLRSSVAGLLSVVLPDWCLDCPKGLVNLRRMATATKIPQKLCALCVLCGEKVLPWVSPCSVVSSGRAFSLVWLTGNAAKL